MATNTYRGTDNPLLQSWETSWSPTTGGNFTASYAGYSLSKISNLAATYAAVGYAGKIRFEHNKASLELSIPSSNVPGATNNPFTDISDKWEIAVDVEKPELFENETFLSIVQAHDSATTWAHLQSKQIILAIKESASNPQLLKADGKVDSAAKDVTPWDSFNSKLKYRPIKNATGGDIASSHLGDGINVQTGHPCLNDFAIDYFEGRTSFVRSKYVVRHQTNAPSNYADNVADFNVERIYSVSRLITECTDTGLWIMPMPGYLVYKINNFDIPGYIPSNYYWGGLKMRSNAVTAARGRVEIQTEYLLDGWPQHTYGNALT